MTPRKNARKERYIPARTNKKNEMGTKQIIKNLKFNGRPFLASEATAKIPAADPKGVHPPPSAPEKTRMNHK